MPRKPMTEEQKEAARARLAEARKAKAAKAGSVDVTDHAANEPTTAELAAQIQELKAALAAKETNGAGNDLVEALKALAGQNGGSQVQKGRLVGTTEKFSTDLSLYSDPRERLSAEPRLRRVNFDLNYELGWEVGVTQYETKDGVNMKEPKFTLSLNQVVIDEDGEPTNQRIGKAKMIFFEDPLTAVVVANQLGLPVDEENEAAFLDEMRYYRMRDWLFECFWPAKPQNEKGNLREMVIGGQVVPTWEVSSESNATIPFNELDTKLKA